MDTRQTAEVNRLLTKARHDGDVLAVLLFGSVARDEQTPRSDIDVCLVLVPPTAPRTCASVACKRLEYLPHVDLDVHIFQALPLYIWKRVLKEGRILFVRDEDRLDQIAFHTARAFEDFRPIYDHYLEQVARAGS
jgi:predicted nucleotidyltransferase